MQVFYQLVHVDFVPLITILYLFIFMKVNDAYDHKINGRFALSLLLLILLLISDNIDFYCSGLTYPTFVRKLAIMAGYILRVYLLMSIVFILRRDRMQKNEVLLLVSPAVLNTFVILTAFFSPRVFWLDEGNVLHREILSYAPHLLAFAYFCIVLLFAAARYRRGHHDEGLMLFLSLASSLTGVVGEIVLKTRGLLIAAVSLMLAFYYLYLHLEHFKRDNLTGTLNRMSFFSDIQKFKPGQITAFAEFDLNDLKIINDNEGHAAGDEALVTTANIILRYLPRRSYLYRLGGDEFGVLFCNTRFDTVIRVIERIQDEFEKTTYTCAIGSAEWEKDKDFTEVYNLADKRMYIDKERIKNRKEM